MVLAYRRVGFGKGLLGRSGFELAVGVVDQCVQGEVGDQADFFVH